MGEILQAEFGTTQHIGHGHGRRHQQALTTHMVDSGRFHMGETCQHGQIVGGGPFLAGQQQGGCPVSQRRAVTGSQGAFRAAIKRRF